MRKKNSLPMVKLVVFRALVSPASNRLCSFPTLHFLAPLKFHRRFSSATSIDYPPLHHHPQRSGINQWRRCSLNHDRDWGLDGTIRNAGKSGASSSHPSILRSCSSLAEMGSSVLSTADPITKPQLFHLAYAKRRQESLPIGVSDAPSRAARPTKSQLCSQYHSSTSQGSLKDSIQAAIEEKNYQKLPDLLATSKEIWRNPNPFSFLSSLSEKQQIHMADEILQSLIPVRPRSRPYVVYSCLLSHFLGTRSPLPLALAIIQRILRSGCLPAPQTHLLLSKAWLERRQRSQGVLSILLEMDSIGYAPDCGTCNYLIQSLCKIDQFEEAVKVLHGMGKACIPDLDSYDIVISDMSEHRKTGEVVEMVKEMVARHGLNPRKETILKALRAMRANRDMWRAAGMIEFLETNGVHIDFEAYEIAVECCVENQQFVVAGKFAVKMTERKFIPYIKVRQRLVEGLVRIGELHGCYGVAVASPRRRHGGMAVAEDRHRRSPRHTVPAALKPRNYPIPKLNFETLATDLPKTSIVPSPPGLLPSAAAASLGTASLP